MGRTATINKLDVSNARDALRSAGKPHGIIAIRRHLGRGSPGLIGRLLGDVPDAKALPFFKKRDRSSLPGADSAAPNFADVLARRDQELVGLRRTVSELERRVATAEAKYAAVSAVMSAKELEITRQREIFERWRSDLLRDGGLLASPVDQLTVTISRSAEAKVTRTSHSGEQLDLYARHRETT